MAKETPTHDQGSAERAIDPASRLEWRKLAVEKYKARLEYRKFVLGSVYVAIALALIPALFQLATAALEYVKSEANLRKDQEVFRQAYVKEFLNSALAQDIELRIRFAQYFAYVSMDPLKQGWTEYHGKLIAHREEIRKKIDETESKWQKAQQAKPRDDTDVDRLERNLNWFYKEVGYVQKDRSVATNPRLQDRASEPTTSFVGPLSNAEQALLATCKAHNITDVAQLAYVLATVRFETAQTFQPVREAFSRDEAWRKQNLPYYPYYGRGYILLTWRANYEKMGKLVGQDNLVDDPDKALDPKLAAQIACVGMREGSFTGRKLSDFVIDGAPDFINARRIINGLDRATEIAVLADQYLLKLKEKS